MNIIYLIFIILSVNCYAQVEVQFADNKSIFLEGEPVIFNLQVKNSTSGDISICGNSNSSVFSYNYQKNAYDLESVAPYDRPFVPVTQSHKFGSSPSKPYAPHVCEVNSDQGTVVSSEEVIIYPILINECGNLKSSNCIGKYNFLLPSGKYRIDVSLVLSTGEIKQMSKDFEITDGSPEFNKSVNDFYLKLEEYFNKNIFLPAEMRTYKHDDINSFQNYIRGLQDSILISKGLLQLSRFYGYSEGDLNAFVNLTSKADKKTIFYLLKELSSSEFLLSKPSAESQVVYDKLLVALTERDPSYSDYLLKRLKLKIKHQRKDREKLGYKINLKEDDVARLKNYSRSKKK